MLKLITKQISKLSHISLALKLQLNIYTRRKSKAGSRVGKRYHSFREGEASPLSNFYLPTSKSVGWFCAGAEKHARHT